MKDIKNKIKEPYTPENTPNPPQIIDPSQKNERNENDKPVGDQPASSKLQEEKSTGKGKTKPKKLGESETEIDDETII